MNEHIPQLTKPAAWQRQESHQTLLRRENMKRLMIVLTVLFVSSISAFAQMGTGQGGGMMGGNWGWGMGYGWGFGLIIVILVVVGIVYMMKRK
jgi:uncharacterized membrane protein